MFKKMNFGVVLSVVLGVAVVVYVLLRVSGPANTAPGRIATFGIEESKVLDYLVDKFRFSRIFDGIGVEAVELDEDVFSDSAVCSGWEFDYYYKPYRNTGGRMRICLYSVEGSNIVYGVEIHVNKNFNMKGFRMPLGHLGESVGIEPSDEIYAAFVDFAKSCKAGDMKRIAVPGAEFFMGRKNDILYAAWFARSK